MFPTSTEFYWQLPNFTLFLLTGTEFNRHEPFFSTKNVRFFSEIFLRSYLPTAVLSTPSPLSSTPNPQSSRPNPPSHPPILPAAPSSATSNSWQPAPNNQFFLTESPNFADSYQILLTRTKFYWQEPNFTTEIPNFAERNWILQTDTEFYRPVPNFTDITELRNELTFLPSARSRTHRPGLLAPCGMRWDVNVLGCEAALRQSSA